MSSATLTPAAGQRRAKTPVRSDKSGTTAQAPAAASSSTVKLPVATSPDAQTSTAGNIVGRVANKGQFCR
ncbi:MAG: hypothetical protein KME26_11865 [Oscillatoria princeps RMCB-10]|nr:hypothetical protein [Oscillatoria princeps RMCB-10]